MSPRLLLAAILALVVLSFAPSAGAAGQELEYDIIDLGSLTPNDSSVAFAISNSGYIAGRTSTHAVFWYKESIGDLGGAPAGSVLEATGVNNRGELVGDTFNFSTFTSLPFWTDRRGPLQPLPTLGVANARATSINDHGEIAGTAFLPSQDPFDNLGGQRAVIWRHGDILDLGTLGGPSSIADFPNILNNRGNVVGAAEFDTRVNPVLGGYGFRAALWTHTRGPALKAQDLGSLANELDNSVSYAQGLNESDEVVGWSLTDIPDTCFGGPQQWGFLWKHGRMQGLPPLAGDCDAEATAINNRGQVVGSSIGLSATGQFMERAVIWIDGQLIDLSTLIPSSSGWTRLIFGNGINDEGEIVGFGTNPQKIGRAFLLRPHFQKKD